MATARAARAAIVLIALALSAAVLCAGAAVRLERTDPSQAPQFAPYDARAAMAAAEAAVQAGTSVQAPEVRRLVGRALSRDATLPSAIELRALDADSRRAARLFELSDAISRRSLPTRLWLIQRSVDRGDVAGALEDFDIALRTSSAAPKVLFPVLAGATADPALAGPIARVLDRPEDWRVMFLNYAVAQGHAVGAADVVLHMRDRQAITHDRIDRTLVAKLAAEREFALTRRVHDAFHPSPAALIRDPDFSDPQQEFPFGWALTDRGDLTAERSRIGGRPALAYRSLAGTSGAAAVQLLMLPPGDYRLSVKTAAQPASPPYWTLVCGQDGGAQIAVLEGDADFTIPPACPAQWLTLNLRPDSAGALASVSIARR